MTVYCYTCVGGDSVSGVQSIPRHRRLRFVESPVVIYFEEDGRWTSEEYRQARVGPWVREAADRARFRRRIRHFNDIFEQCRRKP